MLGPGLAQGAPGTPCCACARGSTGLLRPGWAACAAHAVRGARAAPQVEFADVVVVNKVDGLAPGELPRLLAALAALNPGARLLPAEYGRVDARELVGARRFDADAAAGRAGWQAELHAAAEARAGGGGAAERDGGGGAAPARGHAHPHAHAGAGRGAPAAHYGVSTFVYHARRCALRAARRCARAPCCAAARHGAGRCQALQDLAAGGRIMARCARPARGGTSAWRRLP